MSVEINMNKTRVKKKYKRYWQHAARAGTGQDTAHRPQEVSEDEMRIRWCITWHRDWNYTLDWCDRCHTTGDEVYALTKQNPR